MKCKKGVHNKLVNMLSWTPIITLSLSTIMKVQPSVHNEYISMCGCDHYFHDIMNMVKLKKSSEFTSQNGLLYKGSQLCDPSD